jgi:hypothetical protein
MYTEHNLGIPFQIICTHIVTRTGTCTKPRTHTKESQLIGILSPVPFLLTLPSGYCHRLPLLNFSSRRINRRRQAYTTLLMARRRFVTTVVLLPLLAPWVLSALQPIAWGKWSCIGGAKKMGSWGYVATAVQAKGDTYQPKVAPKPELDAPRYY